MQRYYPSYSARDEARQAFFATSALLFIGSQLNMMMFADRTESSSKIAALLFAAVLPACQLSGNDVKNTAAIGATVPQEDFTAANNLISKRDLPMRAFAIVEKLVAANKLPGQFAAQTYAFMGIESAAEKIHFSGVTPRAPTPISTAELQALDAMQEIVAAAKKHRIVVINDSRPLNFLTVDWLARAPACFLELVEQ